MGSYVPVTPEERRAMLERIGLPSVEALYADVPEGVLLKEPPVFTGGFSELEVRRHMERLAEQNRVFSTVLRGAGAYDHYIPAVVRAITGMDRMTFQPAAGAHGEYMGLLLIKAYHERRGDKNRTKVLVPDSAHGTNPASAAMCGYQVVSIPSDANGLVDLEKLREAAGPDTAALMLTNPNTVGLFDPNILQITRIVHEALMVEPTETESKESLEAAAESYLKVLAEANENPADMHSRPLTTYVRRLDEVTAARSPIVKYEAPTA